MRTKLTDIQSIPLVAEDMTEEEKLNLVGAWRACHTLEIPDMDIPALCLMDGATGVNGTQIILDYITSPDVIKDEKNAARMAYASPELVELVRSDLVKELEKCGDDPVYEGLIRHTQDYRPSGRQFVSFPSGINIGAAFHREQAGRIGEAVGWELRDAGIDVCMGPNVDIMRDPLGGRNYEMYGEDPYLVGETAAAFIRGMQSVGVGACAKHFLANNQETNRNTKDTHLSERTMMEIYSRAFFSAVKNADVKCIMSAYNAINGEFTSYSRKLLTGILRDRWDFKGVVLSDWGAAADHKEDSLRAGMDLILCGPSDMEGCRKALEEGRLTREELDLHVERILKLIVELKEKQRSVPARCCQEELLQCAFDTVVDGSVLLKNERDALPLKKEEKVAFYGRRSKEMLECGSGSTYVTTTLHSNVYEEYGKLQKDSQVIFGDMENADTVVYTVAAPAGENVDREAMDIEEEDREELPRILREAKEKGKKTVVLLNISGPVDMRGWLADADAVLGIFIPGCTGGAAAAAMLAGKACPAGKLPVSFPVRCEDTPSYPNFPGEHNDVYYGEGIFVGYRSYEKRKLPVQYPFGFGLSYTTFSCSCGIGDLVFDTLSEESILIPVSVKNTGNRRGSEVIQVYCTEKNPHILRPLKELAGYGKVTLEPGEERLVHIEIRKESLQCFDAKQRRFVLPAGAHLLSIGTSSQDIFKEVELEVKGTNPYPLNGDSTIDEILRNPAAVAIVDEFTGGMFEKSGKEQLDFMRYRKLNEILAIGMIQSIPDAVQLDSMLQGLYGRLEAL